MTASCLKKEDGALRLFKADEAEIFIKDTEMAMNV